MEQVVDGNELPLRVIVSDILLRVHLSSCTRPPVEAACACSSLAQPVVVAVVVTVCVEGETIITLGKSSASVYSEKAVRERSFGERSSSSSNISSSSRLADLFTRRLITSVMFAFLLPERI